MADRPRLSVLMPNYNHARFVGIALDAILGQSRRADEIILVDDVSTDNSVEVMTEYAAVIPVFDFPGMSETAAWWTTPTRCCWQPAETILYSPPQTTRCCLVSSRKPWLWWLDIRPSVSFRVW